MTVLLIISVILACCAIALLYWPSWWGVAVAFVALLLAGIGPCPNIGFGSLLFWCLASALAIGLWFMLPSQVNGAKAGMPFLATGALAGMVIGALLNTEAAIIIGTAIGVGLAALAFGRMPAGCLLAFPSKRYWNYVLAKGFPLVIGYSMIGLLMLNFLYNYQ